MVTKLALVLFGLVILFTALGLTARPFASHTQASGHELLPDLQTLPPRDIEIVNVRNKNVIEKRLRFDNRIWNSGVGPLEVYPVSQDCDGDGDRRNDRTAMQRVYTESNATAGFQRGGDAVSITVAAGCMVFHNKHHHWHIEDFATYRLRSVATDGVVAESTKVSFCMIDTFSQNLTLTGAPASRYYTQCGTNATYGISIGWGDEYQSTLADQYIVINGVANGDYCLESIADPLNHLLEADDTNNRAGVRINIFGNIVTPGADC